jgi:hypothetical protein
MVTRPVVRGTAFGVAVWRSRARKTRLGARNEVRARLLAWVRSRRVGETIGRRSARRPVPEPISAQRSERWAGFVATGTAIGQGRPAARTILRPAVRVGAATLPFPESVQSQFSAYGERVAL